MSKFIFVTGGVCSSLGKGIVSASLGALLESRGQKVTFLKVDPYLNVDAGTMSPYQHGEVYVTPDGAETDLDLGNYSRFTSFSPSHLSSVTSGGIYWDVLNRERRGDYLGRCVQMIPHITNAIKERFEALALSQNNDGIVIVEIGGTVGDIESLPFLEAVSQSLREKGLHQAINLHVAMLLVMSNGEIKTKPTQHSVRAMRELGVQPSILMCRAPEPLSKEMKEKLSLFSNIPEHFILSAPNFQSDSYEAPSLYEKEGLGEAVAELLSLPGPSKEKTAFWSSIATKALAPREDLTIAIAGKYARGEDTYKSVEESLSISALSLGKKIKIKWVEAESLSSPEEAGTILSDANGLLIPGGFGVRGTEGMITAIHWARENAMPFFGICFGMQMAVIEHARYRLGLTEATSTEFDESAAQGVISLLSTQEGVEQMGASMRLGDRNISLTKGGSLEQMYHASTLVERHRHRYEVNPRFKEQLLTAGLQLEAVRGNAKLVEAVSWKDHPFGLAVQYHPEFDASLRTPSPLFSSFLQAAIRRDTT